jgi:hypothetical protein
VIGHHAAIALVIRGVLYATRSTDNKRPAAANYSFRPTRFGDFLYTAGETLECHAHPSLELSDQAPRVALIAHQAKAVEYISGP